MPERRGADRHTCTLPDTDKEAEERMQQPTIQEHKTGDRRWGEEEEEVKILENTDRLTDRPPPPAHT